MPIKPESIGDCRTLFDNIGERIKQARDAGRVELHLDLESAELLHRFACVTLDAYERRQDALGEIDQNRKDPRRVLGLAKPRIVPLEAIAAWFSKCPVQRVASAATALGFDPEALSEINASAVGNELRRRGYKLLSELEDEDDGPF